MGLGEWYHDHVAVPWEKNVAAPVRNWINDNVIVPVQEKFITPIQNYWRNDNTYTTADDNTNNQAVIPSRVLTPAESIAEWNASYNKLINQIANCKRMEERSELVSNHQEKLVDFKASNLPVDNHLAYLCVTIEGKILPNNNGQLLTGEEAWKYNYDKLINQIANCKSMDERRALVSNHQEELVKFKDSKLPVDNDLAYLKVSLLPNSNQQQEVSPQTFEQYQAQLMKEQGATQTEIDEQQRRNAAVIRDTDKANNSTGDKQLTEYQGLNPAEVQQQADATKVLIRDADTGNSNSTSVTPTPFKDTEDLQRQTMQQQAGYTPEEIEKTIQAYKYLLKDINEGKVSQDDPVAAKTFEEYQKAELLGHGYSAKDADQKIVDNQNVIKDGNLSKEDAVEMLSLQVKYGTKAALGYAMAKVALTNPTLTPMEKSVFLATGFVANSATSAISSETGAAVKDFINGSGSKEKEKVANGWKENAIKDIAWSNVSIPGMDSVKNEIGALGGGVLQNVVKDGILKGFGEIKSRFPSDGNAHGETPASVQEQHLNFRTNQDESTFKSVINSSGTHTILRVDPKFKEALSAKTDEPHEFQSALELMKASTKFTNECIAAREQQNTQSLGQGQSLGYSRGRSR